MKEKIENKLSDNYKDCILSGYEGLYRIYDNGSIYSYRKRRMLKTSFKSSVYRYEMVLLTGHGNNKRWFAVHRLVAMHFIRMPRGKEEINHIDSNTLNNHVSNLQWTTRRENMIKAYNKNMKDNKGCGEKGESSGLSTREKMAAEKMKKVVEFDCFGNTVIYNSIQEWITKNNSYRKKFDRIVNSYKTHNGMMVRFLND